MKPSCFIMLPLLLLSVLRPPAVLANTWYANAVAGNDTNSCKSAQTACKTIMHAISSASSGDTIMVAPAVYTENLVISFSLNVIGAGASTTIIDGGGAGRVVTIPNSGIFTLSNVTIRNGVAPFGGGIYNHALLIINNSTLGGNVAFGRARGFFYGGGIYNQGTLTINNSTLSGNSVGCGFLACAGYGGGIYNSGEVLINNSTINGNMAYAHGAYSQGGGIANSGILTISNSTLSGNGAARGGGLSGSATIQNSIVSNNSASNCSGTMTSHGHNLSSDGSCNFQSAGDLNNHDPLLGPLENNGGPTQTMALLPGSPAIDGGNPAGCTDGRGNLLKTDQRGMPRPDPEDTAGCDMGAYERQND